MSRKEIQTELSALGKRLDGLKTNVAKNETRIVREGQTIQGRLADVKKQIGAAENTVKTLQQTVKKAALPELRTTLERINRDIARMEAQLRRLSKDAAEYGKAVESIYKQAFYNDPREQQRP
jgi:chromosome segregation ATPase